VIGQVFIDPHAKAGEKYKMLAAIYPTKESDPKRYLTLLTSPDGLMWKKPDRKVLPAGNVAMATGFEYRHEQQRNRRDPLQLGATGVFQSGNFSEFGGQYHVEEGFLEFNIPVLRNNIVDSFDLRSVLERFQPAPSKP
jgi:hypothetical protein